MTSRHLAAWLLAAMMAVPARALQVVTTSGTRVDGVGIAGFDEPQASGGALYFRSTSTSIALGGLSFATGDPLPGFQGAIEDVLQGETAGALSAVLLSATGPELTNAIFLVEGGTVTPLVTTTPVQATRIRSFTMNQRGDVAYLAREGSAGAVHLRPRATGVDLVIGEPSRTLRALRGLVIDADGAVAWMDSRGGAWRWDSVQGAQFLTDGSRALRRSGASPIAIHAPEGVAVVQRTVATLWPADAGIVTTLLSRSEEVEGRRIRTLYGDVGFLDDGTVVLRARASRAPSGYVCIKGDAKAFCSGPGRPSAGSATRPSSAASIFRARGRTLAALVRPGDELPGAGLLADVESFVASGGKVTFLGMLTDGRRVLARQSRDATTVVAVDGTAVGTRTLTLSSLLAARGTTVLVGASVADATGTTPEDASALAVVRGRGLVQPILQPRRGDGLGVATAAVFAGGAFVVFSDGSDGLFVARHGRFRRLLVPGKGSARDVGDLDAMVASGGSIVLAGTDKSGAAALYELRSAGFRRVLGLPDLPSLLSGGAGGEVALLVTTTPDAGVTSVDQLWTVRDGRASTVATVGDATPLGTLDSIDGIALDGHTLAVAASLTGSGPHRALLTVER